MGIALGIVLNSAFSGLPLAQQIDPNTAAEAKAQAGREALSLHPAADPPGPKAAGTFITFDAPGAGTGRVQGTFPADINQAGDITGSYVDANYVSHGFVRAGNGTFTTFDVPGGTTTGASGINPAGAVTGGYTYLNDPNFVSHGFVRTRDGTFATFDAPGIGVLGIGIFTSSINPAGTTAGTYADANFVLHCFLRGSDGTVSRCDAPGADTNPADFPNGTQAVAINPEGVILGQYTDTNQNNHGYLRAAEGSFTTFDPPGNIMASNFSGGIALAMNPAGVIAGTYFQIISGNPFGGNFRVFIRATDGTFTTFDAATYPPCCIWSFASGINPAGAIIGFFNDGFNKNHGFLRASNGTVTLLDVPAAGTGDFQGTMPVSITPNGVVMGHYSDANSVIHGFLFLPRSCC
jgi:hypothetical protein